MEDDKQQQNIEPEKFEITTDETQVGTDISKHRMVVKIDAEEIIAIFGGFIAVIVALGMIFGSLPVNKLTISVLTFSGVGSAIAAIIGARKKKRK